MTTTEHLQLYFFVRGPSGSGATESEMTINLEENMRLLSIYRSSKSYSMFRREFARLDEDYRAPSPSPVTFPSGSVMEAMQTVRIEMIDDDENENDEILSYRIITQPGVTLVPLSAFTGGGGIVEEANNNFRFALIFRN